MIINLPLPSFYLSLPRTLKMWLTTQAEAFSGDDAAVEETPAPFGWRRPCTPVVSVTTSCGPCLALYGALFITPRGLGVSLALRFCAQCFGCLLNPIVGKFIAS